jgi:hypothetical protein
MGSVDTDLISEIEATSAQWNAALLTMQELNL